MQIHALYKIVTKNENNKSNPIVITTPPMSIINTFSILFLDIFVLRNPPRIKMKPNINNERNG